MLPAQHSWRMGHGAMQAHAGPCGTPAASCVQGRGAWAVQQRHVLQGLNRGLAARAALNRDTALAQ